MEENKEIAYSDSNRIGKFSIMFEMLEDRELIGALMALMAPVLEAYPHESGRGTTFVAASELFQELQEGDEIPEYRIEFDHPTRPLPPERARECTKSGAFGFRAIRNTIVRVPPATFSHKALH